MQQGTTPGEVSKMDGLYDQDAVMSDEEAAEAAAAIVDLDDAPTHRGRLAVHNMVDLLEDLANGDGIGDWEDAAVWALEIEEDYVLRGVL